VRPIAEGLDDNGDSGSFDAGGSVGALDNLPSLKASFNGSTLFAQAVMAASGDMTVLAASNCPNSSKWLLHKPRSSVWSSCGARGCGWNRGWQGLENSGRELIGIVADSSSPGTSAIVIATHVRGVGGLVVVARSPM